MDTYSKSKLANVQFTIGLTEKLSKFPNIKAMSLHPGIVASDFAASAPCCSLISIFNCLCCCIFVKTETGARTSLYLSRIKFGDLKNGEYYDSDTSIGAMNDLGKDKV
jgi:short-subunit dehydrogenase